MLQDIVYVSQQQCTSGTDRYFFRRVEKDGGVCFACTVPFRLQFVHHMRQNVKAQIAQAAACFYSQVYMYGSQDRMNASLINRVGEETSRPGGRKVRSLFGVSFRVRRLLSCLFNLNFVLASCCWVYVCQQNKRMAKVGRCVHHPLWHLWEGRGVRTHRYSAWERLLLCSMYTDMRRVPSGLLVKLSRLLHGLDSGPRKMQSLHRHRELGNPLVVEAVFVLRCLSVQLH